MTIAPSDSVDAASALAFGAGFRISFDGGGARVGNKPTSAKGFSGSVLIVSGANRETVTLVVAGDNSLKGETKAAVPAGAAVTLVLKNAARKSGQVKF